MPAEAGDRSVAVVGSANLTGGLVSNVEYTTVLHGDRRDEPLAATWAWAETLWGDARVTPWTPSREARHEGFDPALLRLLRTAVDHDPVFWTLGPRPMRNRVVEVTETGLYVETERSRARGAPPQLIPAWMFDVAWGHLCAKGELSYTYPVAGDGLNVKRSSGVLAILARLPGVWAVPGRLVALEWVGSSATS